MRFEKFFFPAKPDCLSNAVLRSVLVLLFVALFLCSSVPPVFAQQGMEGMIKMPSTVASYNHYPSKTRSFSFPTEAGRYYSIIISGSMLLEVEHHGTYYRTENCDACYWWEMGDRASGNIDPTDPQPWKRGPRPVSRAIFSNNWNIGLCNNNPYNNLKYYWSGWFQSAGGDLLEISHNVPAHRKNQGSFRITVAVAPRDENPNGIWEYRNRWVDLRSDRQGSGGMRPQPSNIVTVPSVVGMTAKKARDTITWFASLKININGGDPAPDSQSEYSVQSQDPPAGTEVPEGSTVNIVIFGAYEPPESATPNVIGLNRTEAKKRMVAAGFVPTFVTGDPAPQKSMSDTVQNQTPAPGKNPGNQGKVTLTVFAPVKKTATADPCKKKLRQYYEALTAKKYNHCKDILAQSKSCDFYSKEMAHVHKMECLSKSIAILKAKKNDDFQQASKILNQSRDCDFYHRYAQELECSQNLHGMSAAANAGDMNRYRSLLAQSQNCSYYANLSASLQEAERKAAQQNRTNAAIAQTMGQILGGVVREWAANQGTGSGGSSSGSSGSSGNTALSTPVVKEGKCDDVRKAGSNRPERHIIDLGYGRGSFRFDYQTFNEEDSINIYQGSRVLFQSGCVGTNGTRTVQVKRTGFGSKITVEVQPNCDGGRNTQWQFEVHCPQ